MKKKEVEELAQKVNLSIEANNIQNAYAILEPILLVKTPFRYLDIIGESIGVNCPNRLEAYLSFWDEVSKNREMGGYVVVGQALIALLRTNPSLCFRKAVEYLIEGDEWYVCDIIGERVMGHALTNYYESTFDLFDELVNHDNPWVRRSVGVAVHYFAKRCREEEKKAIELMNLLEPQLLEKDLKVIKGIGWGLKTIGRYYPKSLTDYVIEQIKIKKISGVIIRKCTTYLPEEYKTEIFNIYKRERITM